ncbi:hypothetical protein [Nitrospira sp. Kam-Ns4a]
METKSGYLCELEAQLKEWSVKIGQWADRAWHDLKTASDAARRTFK